MNTKYFPYFDETGKATLTFTYNINPALAESLDPRDIITTWNEDSRNLLTHNDIYEGMKIYALDDRKIRICRWTPKALSTCTFTANDCVWDTLHGDEETWIDITTYTAEKSISQLIADAEAIKWLYNIGSVNSYIGFLIGENDNVNMNFIVNNGEGDEHISFTYSAADTKTSTKVPAVDIIPDFSKYDNSVIDEVAGKLMVIFCPSATRTSSLERRNIQEDGIKLNDEIIPFIKETRQLYVNSKKTEIPYDFYLLPEDKFTANELLKLISGDSVLTVTFKKL